MDFLSKSKKTFSSSLDPFYIPDQDVGLQETRCLQISPRETLENGGSITFHIPKTRLYYNLKDSYLFIRASVVNNDGTPLVESDNVAPCSYFFHALFSNVIVDVNGQLRIDDAVGKYHYRATLPLLIGHGEADKDGRLTELLSYRDDKPDDFTDANNPAFKLRKSFSALSKTFEVLGRIASPIFDQGRVILPQTELDVTLIRNSPRICLDSSVTSKAGQTGDPYRVIIKEATLCVKTYDINPEVRNRHEQALQRGAKATYILRDLEIRPVSIPRGQINFTTIVNYTSKIPNLILVTLLDPTAYTGAFNKSFQNYGDHKVTSLKVTFSDSSFIYSQLDVDFANKNWLRAFHTLNSLLPPGNFTGNGISRLDYGQKGNAIFAFELNDSPSGEQFLAQKKGEISLELGFKEATTEIIQMLIFGTQTKVLTIDKEREAKIN